MSHKQGLSGATKVLGIDNMTHWCGKVSFGERAIFCHYTLILELLHRIGLMFYEMSICGENLSSVH